MRQEQKILLRKAIILILILLVTWLYNNKFESIYLTENDNIDLKQIEETKEVINSADNLKIYFLDVGEADSILIENNGEYMLIDAGNNEDGKNLVEFFKSLGVEKFKYVIGTHAHEDHIGGMDDIIENFSIEHFYMPNVIVNNKTFEEILISLDAKNIAFETPNIDSTFTMAESKFVILYIGNDKEDLNMDSIVLKLNYKNTSYLFTGDAPTDIEKEILNKDLKSDVLKIGHHGSRYSTSAQFLKAVHPKYAIISVGKDNEHYHPHKVILDKLIRIGTQVYRTDLEGTILLTSDGNNIYFETIKTNTNGGD
ncbi:MAG: MBL fold metallo-hydrolase [Bacilli bacterium]|nr:MBL fold metallo-hydrolase [Bacilli bacterium]